MIDWVLVRQAAAIEPTNALAAELLLEASDGMRHLNAWVWWL
jgi:hypothetical protein